MQPRPPLRPAEPARRRQVDAWLARGMTNGEPGSTNHRAFLDSVGCALEGLRHAFRTQHNLRIQSIIGTGAVILAIALRLPGHDVVLIIALTTLVLFAELMNTAIESTLDHSVGAQFDPDVKRIKDVAAASVLVACLGAAALGASIFLPALAPNIFR